VNAHQALPNAQPGTAVEAAIRLRSDTPLAEYAYMWSRYNPNLGRSRTIRSLSGARAMERSGMTIMACAKFCDEVRAMLIGATETTSVGHLQSSTLENAGLAPPMR
jgi:hypothetical protein